MKSLVTGGAGFIGSNLVNALLAAGHDVICVDNESSDAHDMFYWNAAAQNEKVDVCDFSAIEPLFAGVDYVFHIAAEARIMSCMAEPIKAVQTNVLGTANVLQAARMHGIKRVMYSSTSAAYGKNESPNDETQPDDCLNPYSVSKVCGEKLCTMYTQLFDVPTIIFRYFNVYGFRQPIRGSYAPVLGVFLRQKQNNEPLTIVGDGQQRRDFVNVIDVVAANILAATVDIAPQLFGTVFNVGTGVNYSVLEIAQRISDNYVFLPQRLGEMKETKADTTKIRTTLGWQPAINLPDYLNEFV